MRKFALVLLVCCCLSLPGMGAAADYNPGLMFSTLLNGFQFQPRNAELALVNLQAVFLPDPASTTYYPYDPDGGGRLWAILSDGSGKELYRLDFYAEKLESPYWLMSSYKLCRAGSEEALYDNMNLSAGGDFVLDFYLESGRFYTFPFSVSKVASDDPFAGEDAYFLDGAWEDWAYFYYANADPSQSIRFKVWLRQKSINREQDAEPRLEVRRGSTLVCTSREHMSYRLPQHWNRFEMDLISPMEGTSGGGYFKASDLLATDGDYTATLYLSGKEYGSWQFKVSSGKLNYTGRTLRDAADPLTFVEGGRDAWWYQK